MPMGDSITQAYASHLSYRYYLWMKLIDAGIDFDFVGSMNSHEGGNPEWPEYKGRSFDRDHEGHEGWHADQMLAAISGGGDGRIRELLQADPPDIVLLHMGTNDIGIGMDVEGTANEIGQIIKALRKSNPNVIIMLAKLIPVRGESTNGRIIKFNAYIEQIGADTSSKASPVIVVDHSSGFDAYADTFDGLHPNESGERKMARKWFEALQVVIEKRLPDRTRKG